jgi:HK97 family phage major capsid protein
MDLEKLKKLLREKYAEAKKLSDEWKGKEEEIPVEVANQISGLLGQCDELEIKIKAAEGVLARQILEEPAGTKAAHLGWRQAGPGEGDAPVDTKAWREIEIKAYSLDPALGMVIPTTRKFRFHVPEAVQQKGYGPAFEAYIRKGLSNLGPQDYKTLAEGVDSAGGYLVPEDLHLELIRKIATMATVRANARVIQTSRDIASWPKLHYTTDDEYTSGVRLTWTGEAPASATTHRVTEPVFGRYAIPVHTAMASLPLTNDLLEDAAFDVTSLGSDLLAEAFTLGENDAFWNGSGITRPMGVLTQVDGDGPASVKSGTASTLLADGLIDLAYALPSQYDRNSKFYFNKQTEKIIRKLKDSDGNYLWPIVAQAGNLGGAPRELLTYPTVRDEFLPNVAANAFPIVFGDMSSYLVVDRVGLSIQRLSELYAETNITLLLARKRVGGQLVQPWRLRVQKVAA